MDGDGEGMVAIIQALHDAGLAITVMDGRYQRFLNLEQQARERLAITRILALKKSLEVPQFHSSVETSTLENPHRSSQIGGGTYAGSFQTAQYNTSPTSPQVGPPEFPPQRPSPSTTEGNFLVGGYRSGNNYTPVRASQSYRSSMACQNKGSLNSNRSGHTSEFSNQVSRESEAFVYSLRKYPSMSPERPGSAEMVQRLINYTQSKNSKKRWHRSKSMRSLPDTNNKTDKQTPNKSSKNIQTYTRSGSTSPVKNDSIVNNIEETRSRNVILKSPVSDCRNVRYKDLQDNRHNETYDYLKYSTPTQRKFYRSPEVRYLTDVTKRFRDTLRHIYGDNPIMCEKMRNRYTNHEREHHPERQRQQCEHHSSRADFISTEVKASSPTVSRATTADKYKNVYTDSPSPGCSKSCQLPLNCKPKTSYITCACPKNIIDDAINEWVKNIPVNSAESRSDTTKREDLIKILALKLKELVEDDDFRDKARDEIEKCVNYMPIWNPASAREQDALKNLIIENLYSKVKNLNNNDILRESISKWLDVVHLRDKDYGGNIVVKKQVVDDLVNKIKPLKNRDNGKENVFKVVKKEIEDSVDKLPIVLRGTKSETVNVIATKLTDILEGEQNQKEVEHESSKSRIRDGEKRNQEYFNNTAEKGKRVEKNNTRIQEKVNKAVSEEIKKLVENWSTDVSNLKSSIDKNKANEELAKQLLEIKTSNRNIKLTEALAKEQQLKRTEEELNKIKLKADIDKAIYVEVKKLVNNWENKITHLHNKIDKSKAIEELTNQLVEIKSTNKNIENMINRMQNVLPTETVEAVAAKVGKVFMKEHETKRKEDDINKNKIKNEVDKAVYTKIKMLMDDWSSNMANLQSSIQRNSVTEKLSIQLIEIKSTNIEDMINQMQHVISNETVEGVSSKLVEVLTKDKKERQREEELMTAKFVKVIDKAVGTEIKGLIEDCSKNIASLKESIDKNSVTSELTKQLLEIKSVNMNIEDLINQMKSDIPTETVVGVSEKLSKVIEKEQEQKRKEDENNNAKLKTDVEKAVSRELKKLLHEWKDNIVNLQSSIGKNIEAEKLMKQLLEIKSKNANIEEMIHQLKYTIPNETVEGVTKKISEILINEQRQSSMEDDSKRFRTENDIDKAITQEVKKLIIDWNNDIANLKSSIDRNRTETLTRQLLGIKSTNLNIKDMLHEMQDTIKTFMETVILQKSDGRANNKISTKLIEKIQNLETLLAEKLRILSEQDHFSINEQDMFNQITEAPNIIRQISQQLSSDSYERNRSNESPGISKSTTINIPKKRMRRMEDLEDIEISHSQNMTPKQRLRNYYKEKHSLTDPIGHIGISDVKTDGDEQNKIEDLLKNIQELQIQGFDQDIILDEIDDWLDKLSKKTEMDIPIREREAVAKKLIEYFEKNKPRKRWDQCNDKRKTFVNDISDLIDNELVKFGENRKIDMKNKTVSILESTTDEMSKVPSGDLKEFIREELKEMLEHYKVGITNKELEDMISHMLADQIMRGVDSDKSRGKVYSMLQEDNIPKSKAADISMKLTDRVREMSLAHKAKDSSMFINRSKKVQTTSPFHNEAFKNEAERVILEFIDEFTNDQNFVKETKIKEDSRVLVNIIADIMSEPNENTEDLLKDVIWEYFNKISLQSDTPILELVDELAGRILSIHINTSTPRKEKRSSQSKQDSIESSQRDKMKSFRTVNANTSKRFNDEISVNLKDLCLCDLEKLEIDYNENLTKIISNWIEGFPIKIDKKFKANMTKDLVSDILDRQKYLQLNPKAKTSDREELEHLKYQVFKWLYNLPGIHDFFNFMPRTEDLMQQIKKVYIPVLVKNMGNHHSGAGNKIAEETFDSILEEWFANLPIKSRKTCSEIIEVERLKADFKCRLEHLHMSLNKEAMRAEIRKFLLNVDSAKNNNEYYNEKINELMELLESVPWVNDTRMYGDSDKLLHLEDSREINRTSLEDLSTSKQVNLSSQSIRPPSSPRKPCNILSDYIIVWFDNLPIITDSPEQGEEVKSFKQSLASQLINKVGEMNINQDMFNDDYLYQEILKDEIDSLLNELPMNAELKSRFYDLKQDLICKIMEARERTKQEIAGQRYKRNLRETISKSLPLQNSMNLQDLAELDVLKDNLADAYMNLHFYGADNDLLDKYKTKISDEITKFCNNYLNRHPDASVDNEKLKLELFYALQNVEIHNEEILTREIEQARIRDEINDWIKELPLKEQTRTELLQRNKMIALLAKKLHDIETDGEMDDNEINDKTKKEVLKFLYKLPLIVNDDKSVSTYADKLIGNLNRNASSRRYSASKTLRSLKDTSLSLWITMDNSVDDTEDRAITKSLNMGSVTVKSTNLDESTKDKSSKEIRSNYVPIIPQSTLSTADRAYLEEIRVRTLNACSVKLPSTKRDAAVSPLPTEVASQTDMVHTTLEKDVNSPVCPGATCPSRLVRCKSPAEQAFKSTSPMQKDVAIDNTDIGGSQEMRTTTAPNQPEICSEAMLSKEQNQQIEKSLEFQQQTDLPGPITAASQIEPIASIIEDVIPITHGNSCPGVQNISECYNKTCPSIKEFLQKSNEYVRLTVQKIPYGQNAVAGTSKPDISPQVIIKEHYLSPSDPGTNRPGRSCLSINSRGDQTRTRQGRFPHRQYNEEYASRPTQTSCSNIEFRGRNFRSDYRVSDDEDFWISPNVVDDTDTRDRVPREEEIRCRCKERVVTKCRPRCVQRCPHPSCLYFR